MSHSNLPGSHRSDEEASLWAARLEGDTFSPEDRQALALWLTADPKHRALLSEYCQFSANLEEKLPILVESGVIAMPPEKPAARSRWTSPWLAGVALAAAASLAMVLWFSATRNELQTIATSVAQRQSITLSDGTKVELNAHTSLLVDLGAKERHVRLAEGEAFFTVSKDKSRPFIVETPNGSVRVTGTVFDVRAEASTSLDVTVVEGSVQVRPGEFGTGLAQSPVSLAAGDRLHAASTGVSVENLPSAELENLLAWRQGQVVFEGVVLSEALNRFARYHGRGISASPEVANLRIGGRFSLDDPEGFFSALEQVLPVRVTRDLSGATLVIPRHQH